MGQIMAENNLSYTESSASFLTCSQRLPAFILSSTQAGKMLICCYTCGWGAYEGSAPAPFWRVLINAKCCCSHTLPPTQPRPAASGGRSWGIAVAKQTLTVTMHCISACSEPQPAEGELWHLGFRSPGAAAPAGRQESCWYCRTRELCRSTTTNSPLCGLSTQLAARLSW